MATPPAAPPEAEASVVAAGNRFAQTLWHLRSIFLEVGKRVLFFRWEKGRLMGC